MKFETMSLIHRIVRRENVTRETVCDLSTDLEKALFDDYDEMQKRQPEFNDYLQEYLPEICAEVEPNDQPDDFVRKVRAVFGQALKRIDPEREQLEPVWTGGQLKEP